MRVRYLVVLVLMLSLAAYPKGLKAQTDVFTQDLTGMGDSFPPNCMLPTDTGGFVYNGGQLVTVTTISYNQSGTAGFVNVLTYYKNATATGFGTLDGVDIDNAQYRIIGISDGLNFQLQNGYAENDQVVYMNYIGKGPAPDISGYQIIHIAVWVDSSGNVQTVSNIQKSQFSCPGSN